MAMRGESCDFCFHNNSWRVSCFKRAIHSLFYRVCDLCNMVDDSIIYDVLHGLGELSYDGPRDRQDDMGEN